MPGRHKLSTETVRSQLKSLGWTLLSEYQGTRVQVRVQCEAGHESHVFLHNLRKGQQCAQCGAKDTRLARAIAEFKKRGFTLLSRRYANQRRPLRCRCRRCKQVRNIPLQEIIRGKICRCSIK